jgi:hypothetical protein
MTSFPDIELKVTKVGETYKGQAKKHRLIMKIMLTIISFSDCTTPQKYSTIYFYALPYVFV